MKAKQHMRVTVISVIALILLLAFDQFTKYLAVTCLKGKAPVVLIPGALEFQYLENRGAAFGSLQNMQGVFWILTLVFLAAALYFFVRMPKTKRYYPLAGCCAVLVAGALGNFIDRVANQYVVDFIYFSLIDFPVFNVADIYITVSFIFILALVFFYYKEGDFSFLAAKKKRQD